MQTSVIPTNKIRNIFQVTVLYVRNLMMSTTEEKLKEIFSLDGKLKVEKVKKLRDFAFVHYRNREDAEEALAKLNGKVLLDKLYHTFQCTNI